MNFSQAFLVLTESCDSRCTLCDYWCSKNPAQMDLSQIDAEVLPLLRRHRVASVCLTGGEPTLHPNLPEICRKLYDAGVSVTLCTSTTSLASVYEEASPFISYYMVSLDGADPQTYASCRGVDIFGHVLSWLEKIVNDGRSEVAVSCVLQKGNTDCVRGVYDLCSGIGVHRLFFRVPDSSPYAFGRKGKPSLRTLRQLYVTDAQVEVSRAMMRSIIAWDSKRGMLGQTPEELMNKVEWLACAAEGIPYVGPDVYCDVPLTSFVYGPGPQVKPCFYLPLWSASAGAAESDDGVLSLKCFNDVYESMLDGADFRNEWCRSCQQFDGHRHRCK